MFERVQMQSFLCCTISLRHSYSLGEKIELIYTWTIVVAKTRTASWSITSHGVLLLGNTMRSPYHSYQLAIQSFFRIWYVEEEISSDQCRVPLQRNDVVNKLAAMNHAQLVGDQVLCHFRFSSAHPGTVYICKSCDVTDEKKINLLSDMSWRPSPSDLPNALVHEGLSLKRQWYLYDKLFHTKHKTWCVHCQGRGHPCQMTRMMNN